jgi:hypothetical protein
MSDTSDSDGDGLTDIDENTIHNTNPNLADTDSDGLNDYDEINVHNTDPNNADTDGDGFDDGTEINNGNDPNDSADLPAETIYEDAENGNTDGWLIFDDDPAGAMVLNMIDPQKQSRVVELAGNYGTSNGYRLFSDDGTNWNNTSQFVIEWDQKFSDNFYFYVDVETSVGHQYLFYSPIDSDMLGMNGAVHHGLGSDADNNTWQTITRDLQADLQDVYPGENIISVNNIFIRGNGYLDNIKLKY